MCKHSKFYFINFPSSVSFLFVLWWKIILILGNCNLLHGNLLHGATTPFLREYLQVSLGLSSAFLPSNLHPPLRTLLLGTFQFYLASRRTCIALVLIGDPSVWNCSFWLLSWKSLPKFLHKWMYLTYLDVMSEMYSLCVYITASFNLSVLISKLVYTFGWWLRFLNFWC